MAIFVTGILQSHVTLDVFLLALLYIDAFGIAKARAFRTTMYFLRLVPVERVDLSKDCQHL